MNLLPSLFSHAFVVDVLRLCLWLAVLTALFVPLERLFGEPRPAHTRSERSANLGYYFLSSLLPAILLAGPTALIAECMRYLIPAAVPALMAALPLAVKVLLGLVIGEVGTYWGHRLSHRIPWLWRFHAIHHSTEHMYFMAHTRTHPVDMVLTRLFGLFPLYVAGLAGASVQGTQTPVIVLLIGTLWGFFIHANVRWRFGPLEWLIATPAFHHWHHSRIEHINRNYAATLPVLDRIFGTYYLPKTWPSAYGVEQRTPASLAGQLIYPLKPSKRTRASGNA